MNRYILPLLKKTNRQTDTNTYRVASLLEIEQQWKRQTMTNLENQQKMLAKNDYSYIKLLQFVINVYT